MLLEVIMFINPISTTNYNKSFIKETFNAMDSIKGIFTLGKSSKEIQMQIIKYKEELNYKKVFQLLYFLFSKCFHHLYQKE